MVQTVLRYNVFDSPEKESFSLRASMGADRDAVEVCAAYTGEGEKSANMAVLEVELLSGYAAGPAGLDALRGEEAVRKVEHDDKEGRVVLYFDDVREEERCWRIAVTKAVAVGELKPAVVRLYDYYKTEDAVSAEYKEEQ